MAEKNNVHKVEVDGVKVSIDERKLNDVRFVYSLGKVSDPAAGEEERMKCYTRMLDILFDDAYQIMCDIADANDGIVDSETFDNFFLKVLEAIGSKN